MVVLGSDDKLNLILSLIHDPTFIAFESEQEAPSIFNAVGRTYTETWHSALLGWLFDPESSHGLGEFPLARLILLLKAEDTLTTAKRGIDLNELLAQGDFSDARVRPNERELAEISVKGVGRFDILVDQIKLEPFQEVQILIEAKVKAQIDSVQCGKYIAHIAQKKTGGTFIIPVFVAPTSQ